MSTEAKATCMSPLLLSIPILLLPILHLITPIHAEITTEHFTAECPKDTKLSWVPDVALHGFLAAMECGVACMRDPQCTGYNYDAAGKTCEIFQDRLVPQDCADPAYVTGALGYRVFRVSEWCLNGGTYDPVSGTCDCGTTATWGARCQNFYKDCSDIYSRGCGDCYPEFGIYPIKPDAGPPFKVKCYLRWGGYTFIMERMGDAGCGKASFNQQWGAYKNGFGALTDFSCDFWIGLEQIRRITTATGRKYNLDVTLRFEASTPVDAYYQTYLLDFYIEDEINNYRAQAASVHQPAVNSPQYPAGDAFFRENDPANSMIGKGFSTPDRDHDASPTTHCASDMQAGWWFSSCGLVNPNGAWVVPADGSRDSSVPSIWWNVDGWGQKAVKQIEIKLFGDDA